MVTGDLLAILAVATSALAAGAGLIKLIKEVRPRARQNLKSDLELLRQLDSRDPSYTMVKEHIEEEVRWLYGPDRDAHAYRKAQILVVATFFVAGVATLVLVVIKGLVWGWYFFPGVLFLMALGGVPDVFQPKSSQAEGHGAPPPLS